MSWIIILLTSILFVCLSNKKLIFGVYAVIFSLPLYFWKFNLINIPFTALEAMIYLLALIFLTKKKQEDGGVFLKNSIKTIKQNVFVDPFLFLGIILLFGGAIIATINSADIRVSAGILKGWFFAPFIFFLLFTSAVKKIGEARRALSVLAFSGALVALAAFIYLFVPEYAGVTYDERLRAFYLSANHLAMYLAPALITVFGFIINKNFLLMKLPKNCHSELVSESIKDKNSFFEWIPKQVRDDKTIFCKIIGKTNLKLMFIVVLIPFLLTYSYGAWLGVFAAIIFILGADCRLGNKKKSSFIYTASLLVILAGIIFSQANPDKFKNIINLTYPSVSSRAVIWDVAGGILKEHWLFGIGPGTFQDYYLKKQADHPPYPEWAVPQPHNIFLAFWLQTGLMGLIGFLMILVWFFKAGADILKNQKYGNDVIASLRQPAEAKPAYRTGRQSREINKTIVFLAIICLAIMIYTLVHGLVDTTYWKNDLALIFWLIIGIMHILKQIDTEIQ